MDRAALLFPADGGYRTTTYAELWQRVDRLAAGLRARGIGAGDRVAILSRNRPEWILADLALLSLGAVDVPLYPTLTTPQVEAILRDAGCRAAFVEGGDLAERLAQAGAAAGVGLYAGFDGRPAAPAGASGVSLEELLDAGNPAPPRPGGDPAREPATIIYTSGTTGAPKGVVLSHRNFATNVEACVRAIQVGPEDVFLSFLPLSHVFERVGGHYVALRSGAATAYAQSPETVVAQFGEVRPTIVLAVPRFFDKVKGRVLARAEEAPPVRRAIARWAFRVAAREGAATRRDVPPRPRGPAHRVADRLAGRTLRARLGGRLRFFVSGGAALAPDTENFFWGLGVPILQGYGLTETSPVVAVNRPGAAKAGTVGPPVEGVEVRIAEDGEILVRGPNVMAGYWGKPEESALVLDGDGWLRTGDVGHLDGDGYLHITDRKKDMIALSTGKKVYPQEVEMAIAESPWVAQLLVLGEGRPCLGALIVPDFAALARRFPDLPVEEAGRGEAIAADPRVRALFEEELRRVMEGLAPYQRVRRFHVLGREFQAERGEVTPTMKLRRAVLAAHFQDLIDSLFAEKSGAWEAG